MSCVQVLRSVAGAQETADMSEMMAVISSQDRLTSLKIVVYGGDIFQFVPTRATV